MHRTEPPCRRLRPQIRGPARVVCLGTCVQGCRADVQVTASVSLHQRSRHGQRLSVRICVCVVRAVLRHIHMCTHLSILLARSLSILLSVSLSPSLVSLSLSLSLSLCPFSLSYLRARTSRHPQVRTGSPSARTCNPRLASARAAKAIWAWPVTR